jgi:hypothetical protein
MNAAESTYTQTESQTWNQYLERLDELNSQLEHTRLILEAAFQTAWNNAVRDWTEMESAAWDAYQRARAQMLQPAAPPEGERQVGPPPRATSRATWARCIESAGSAIGCRSPGCPKPAFTRRGAG